VDSFLNTQRIILEDYDVQIPIPGLQFAPASGQSPTTQPASGGTQNPGIFPQMTLEAPEQLIPTLDSKDIPLIDDPSGSNTESPGNSDILPGIELPKLPELP